MTSVTSALIDAFQKGVALTPKEAFYILQNRGIRTTYKSISKILSRLYYRGILDRSNGRYIFSPGGRHFVSNRATQGDTLKVVGDTQKVQYRTNFPSKSVSNFKKVKRNGIRSKAMRRLMAILMNNNVEFFDTSKFYNSLLTKYGFKVNRNTYRVLIHRLKKRGFLSFRYGHYHVDLSRIRIYFEMDPSVSNSKATGATTQRVPKIPVQAKLPTQGGTPSSVSIRVSEHAPRVDIYIGPDLAEYIIKKHNLKLLSAKDPSMKRKYKGRHLDAIITKNGYVMITPKDGSWLQEVKEVFGERAAAEAKMQNAMKHKEYSLGDIKKLYESRRFQAQVDYSEFADGDIGFQGDAEKVELASYLFEKEIMSKATKVAGEADILIELKRTAEELKEITHKVEDSLTSQAYLNSIYLRKTDENVNKIEEVAKGIISVAQEMKRAMQQFLNIIKQDYRNYGEVHGYA